MKSILQEISLIRNSIPFDIDYQNQNRYRIVANEKDGSKTAYCFSTPIYNETTRKLLDLSFRKDGSAITAVGSNADISITNELFMQNKNGFFRLNLKEKPMLTTYQTVLLENDAILPTTNGIVYRAFLNQSNSVSFEIQVSHTLRKIRANDAYFAIMQEKFKPFVTVSCIGVVDKDETVVAPARISYEEMENGNYRLMFRSIGSAGRYILFEVNLYEEKIIHDTTVESKNPKKNNAFGSVAFIGQTDAFGEQWLYARPNFSNIIDLLNRRINHIILHFPLHGRSKIPIQSYKTAMRFCSFGSNWNKKVPEEIRLPDVNYSDHYAGFDITQLVTDPKTKHIMVSTGFILKPSEKDGGFSVLATGDSYYAPPILEINY